ncbi:MAG TPA: TonB-dependent receptor, partial [Chiayiivirga sp.]|nr:TonB-dependent receptor [Chiayiivirga sp.]
FGACDAAGRCAVPAGARIPGVPRAALAGELRWSNGRGLSAALHLDAVGRMPADDAGRTFAPGFATLGFSAGQEYDLGQYRLAPFVRIDNAFSRSHVGSVIVNQASGASLEPAPGRSMWLGIRVSRSAR